MLFSEITEGFTSSVIGWIRTLGLLGVFLGVIIESVIIPIPSPLIMMGAGFILLSPELEITAAIIQLLLIALVGAFASTLGAYIGYGENSVFNKGFVESPWYSNTPKDLTGAGDAFRAGFFAYLIRNIHSFDRGTFNWYKAGMMGNLTAAVMVTKGFNGIEEYAIMLDRSNSV